MQSPFLNFKSIASIFLISVLFNCFPLFCMKKMLTQLGDYVDQQKKASLAKKKARLFAQMVEAIEAKNNEKFIKVLSHPHFDAQSVDSDGDTPLHIIAAAKKLHYETIDILLAKNAQLNARNNLGQTPLHYATMYGNSFGIDTLIFAGADVNLQDNDGDTPLHYVFALEKYYCTLPANTCYLFHDSYEKIRSLIKRNKARIDIKNAQGQLPAPSTNHRINLWVYWPFMQAVQVANCVTAKHFLTQGVTTDTLHVKKAIYSENYDMLLLLLDSSAHLSCEYAALPYDCETVDMAYFLITHVPRTSIRKQWNNIVIPLLCSQCIRALPVDIQKLLCSYCVFTAAITEQHERAQQFCNTIKYDPYHNCCHRVIPALLADRRFNNEKQWQHAPLWTEQIKQALNRPIHTSMRPYSVNN